MLLKWTFTINTKSKLGSVFRFHSCVAANSKNVKYALWTLLWILVEDMTGGRYINRGFWSKHYHSGSGVLLLLHFSAEPGKHSVAAQRLKWYLALLYDTITSKTMSGRGFRILVRIMHSTVCRCLLLLEKPVGLLSLITAITALWCQLCS